MGRPPGSHRAWRRRTAAVKRRPAARLGGAGLALVTLALLAGPAPAAPSIPRVLVIGLDGTRGDLLQRGLDTPGLAPALRFLALAGRFAPCPEPSAQSCARAHAGPALGPGYRWVTGPGWASVLTGVGPGGHGLRDNEAASLSLFCSTSRRFPTFLERARAAGLATAAGGTAAFLSSAYGQESVPGVLDYECGCSAERPALPRDAGTSCNASARLSLDGRAEDRDLRLSEWLLARVREAQLSVVMGVFDRIDEAGHRQGFDPGDATEEALAEADLRIAPLLAELRSRAATGGERWLVLVTADHGGHRLWSGYGAHDTRAGLDDAVPFGLAAFARDSSRQDLALPLRPLAEPVTQMDAHPTVLRWLGLPVPPDLEGRVQGID